MELNQLQFPFQDIALSRIKLIAVFKNKHEYEFIKSHLNKHFSSQI